MSSVFDNNLAGKVSFPVRAEAIQKATAVPVSLLFRVSLVSLEFYD